MWNSKIERDKEIVRLAQSGMPIPKIADKFSLTRQRVYKILKDNSATVSEADKKEFKRREEANKIIYPNIRSWLLKNYMPIDNLSRKIRGKYQAKNMVYNLLTKDQSKIEIETIKRLLEITGMTFEEAFATDYLTTGSREGILEETENNKED